MSGTTTTPATRQDQQTLQKSTGGLQGYPKVVRISL